MSNERKQISRDELNAELKAAKDIADAREAAGDVVRYYPEMIDGFYINPTDAPAWDVSHTKRAEAEIEKWWGQPYIKTENGRFQVWCLDGGASDRPTFVGSAKSLDEAVDMCLRRVPFTASIDDYVNEF